MNPLVKKQLELLDERIERLADLLADARERAEQARKRRDDLLRAHWGLEQENATLKGYQEQVDALQAENRQLIAERKALRERLESILTKTKRLVSAYRP